MFVFQVSRFKIEKTVTRYCFEYVSTILRDIFWFFDRTFYNEYDQNIFKRLVLDSVQNIIIAKDHQNCTCKVTEDLNKTKNKLLHF